MPKYTPDLAKVQVGFLQLPKGDYEFSVNEVKDFARKRKEKDKATGQEIEVDIYGITYTLGIVSAEAEEGKPFVGRTLPLSLYMHTDKTEGVNFSFAMAALGFPINEVEAFKEKYSDADFSLDTDNHEIGDFWKGIVGTRVAATADLKPQKDDTSKMNQQFSWRPV